MKTFVSLIIVVFLTLPGLVAQDEPQTSPPEAAKEILEPQVPASSPSDTPVADEPKTPDVTGKAKDLAAETQAKVGQLAEEFDQNQTAKEASEGILGPIYVMAESLSFPAFHWLAFGLMSAGVVSFALQLVLGKLVVLFKGSINIREIISDLIGLIISAVGLVLSTQAAAENSSFTHSPAAVLSSAAFGVVVGVTLYAWGQAQEVNAVAGQRAKPTTPRKDEKR